MPFVYKNCKSIASRVQPVRVLSPKMASKNCNKGPLVLPGQLLEFPGRPFNSRLNAFNLVCVVLGEICNRPELKLLSAFAVSLTSAEFGLGVCTSLALPALKLLHKQASYNCIRNGFRTRPLA